jgi:hypothetical protein
MDQFPRQALRLPSSGRKFLSDPRDLGIGGCDHLLAPAVLGDPGKLVTLQLL